jgi:transporter family-2 protein
VNGLVRMESDHIVVPTLVNFSVGTAALVLATAVDFTVRGVPDELPGVWWYYVGGPLGIITIMTAVAAVRFTGVLLLGLASVAGQLTGAVLLDVVVPTAGGLTAASVIGTAITMVAVGVAAIRR